MIDLKSPKNWALMSALAIIFSVLLVYTIETIHSRENVVRQVVFVSVLIGLGISQFLFLRQFMMSAAPYSSSM